MNELSNDNILVLDSKWKAAWKEKTINIFRCLYSKEVFLHAIAFIAFIVFRNSVRSRGHQGVSEWVSVPYRHIYRHVYIERCPHARVGTRLSNKLVYRANRPILWSRDRSPRDCERQNICDNMASRSTAQLSTVRSKCYCISQRPAPHEPGALYYSPDDFLNYSTSNLIRYSSIISFSPEVTIVQICLSIFHRSGYAHSWDQIPEYRVTAGWGGTMSYRRMETLYCSRLYTAINGE